MEGISRLQGGHQEAQRLTKTFLPFNEARSRAAPLMSRSNREGSWFAGGAAGAGAGAGAASVVAGVAVSWLASLQANKKGRRASAG